TKAHLGGDLVPFGNGHLTHVITKTDHFHVFQFIGAHGHPCPRCQFLLYTSILPMSHHHFTVLAHARHHESKFTVAMCRLVQVHEIHIDVAPRNFRIELCM